MCIRDSPCLDGGVVGQVLGRRHVVAVIQLPVGKDVDTGGGDIDVAPLHHHLPSVSYTHLDVYKRQMQSLVSLGDGRARR